MQPDNVAVDTSVMNEDITQIGIRVVRVFLEIRSKIWKNIKIYIVKARRTGRINETSVVALIQGNLKVVLIVIFTWKNNHKDSLPNNAAHRNNQSALSWRSGQSHLRFQWLNKNKIFIWSLQVDPIAENNSRKALILEKNYKQEHKRWNFSLNFSSYLWARIAYDKMISARRNRFFYRQLPLSLFMIRYRTLAFCTLSGVRNDFN